MRHLVYLLIRSEVFALVSFAAADNAKLDSCQGTVKESWGKPTASTPSGLIEGKYVTTGNGFTGLAFYGIPYGEKPARHRFQKVPMKRPWNGTMYAKSYGPACNQNSSFTSYKPDWMSEDCLWLAIYAPSTAIEQQKKYPILYYVYGGDWEVNSNRMFPEPMIFENFVSNGLIFVTVNYRLNAHGFFSTGTADAPGNYGLLDMILSLEWIQKHISAFGGDADRVTVMGHSSAGISVSLLALSPLTDGLFGQVISMSGSAFLHPSTNQDLSRYKKAAVALGCASEKSWNSGNFKPIVNCLKLVEPQELTNTYMAQEVKSRSPKLTTSIPSIDGPGGMFPGTFPRIDGMGGVLSGNVEDLSKNRRSIRTLTGSTNVEMSLSDRSKPQPCPLMISEACGQIAPYYGNSEAVRQACIRHYDVTVRQQPRSFIHQPLKLIPADFMFFMPTYREAENARDTGSDAFLYSFDFTSEAKLDTGPMHGIDLTYLFGLKCDFHFTETDLVIRKKYSAMFSNFVTYGHPMPGSGWKSLTHPTGFNFYSINVTDSLQQFYRFDAVRFWSDVIPYVENFGTVSSQQSGTLVSIQTSGPASTRGTATVYFLLACSALLISTIMVVEIRKLRSTMVKAGVGELTPLLA